MTIVQIKGQVPWKCFRAKGGNWVAICDPLALTIQSETWATLMEDIGQAVNAMFSDLLKEHELPQFLQQHGWKPMGPIPAKAADLWFDIPTVPREVTPADLDKQVALR